MSDQAQSKIYFFFFSVFYFLLSWFLLPFGDDITLGVGSFWVNSGHNLFKEIFSLGEFSLVKSNVEPILAITKNTKMFPLMFQARESAFSYLIVRCLNSLLGPKLSLMLIHYFLGLASFYIINKIIKNVVDIKLSPMITLFLCLNPILYFFSGPYYVDKFVFFFVLLFGLGLVEKWSMRRIVVIAFFGLLSKFIFIIPATVMLISFADTNRLKLGMKRISESSKLKICLSLLLVMLFTLFYTIRESFVYEFFTDHALIKGRFFNFEYLKTIFYLVFDQRKYLEYFLDFQFGRLIIVGNFVLWFTLILSARFVEIKRFLYAIATGLVLFYFAIYEFSNASDYFHEIFVIIVLLKIYLLSKIPDCSKRLITAVAIIISSLEFFSWGFIYTRQGMRHEISFHSKQAIMKQASDLGVDTVYVTSKYDFGVSEFFTDGKIKSAPLRTELLDKFHNICVWGYYSYKFGNIIPIEQIIGTETISMQSKLMHSGFQIYDHYTNGKLTSYLGCRTK